MGFIQIVEFSTTKLDEIRERAEQYRKDTEGKRTTRRAVFCADRDNANRYFIIGEFDSYDEAMKNSNMPETQAMAEDMAKLADGPPTFHNLDVVDTFDG